MSGRRRGRRGALGGNLPPVSGNAEDGLLIRVLEELLEVRGQGLQLPVFRNVHSTPHEPPLVLGLVEGYGCSGRALAVFDKFLGQEEG